MIRIMAMIMASIALLAGCRTRQVVTPVPVGVPEAMRPDWVRSRPLSNAHYIGIGLASKSRSDHQEAAKKNALNDLASEISVVVEGNSLLYTLDQRNRFDESFSSTISTRTSEQLEGFELMGTWENDTEYWTYYRLSRNEHARIKAERKARAIGTATDLLLRARQSLATGDLRNSFDQGLRALLAMRDHWGENDMVEVEGRTISLANEIYGELQAMTSGIRLGILPDRCELDYTGSFQREMLISAQHNGVNGLRDLVQLPLIVAYPGQAGMVTEMRNTDASGHVRTTVQRVDIESTARDLVVRLDIQALVSKEHEPVLVKPIVSSLTVPEKRTRIDLVMPRVFMRADETNMSRPASEVGVATVMREELTRRGFRFVDREADGDLLLDLRSTTRRGGEASGFHTAYLDVSFTLRDRRSGDVVYEGGRQGVKGVQLDDTRAGIEAYKRGAQEVRRDLIPAMIAAMM